MSVGGGPLRYSVHSSGRKTVSARTGIPGVWYQESVGGGRRQSSGPTLVAAAKPGMFAPKGEKALHKAYLASDAEAIAAAGDAFPEVRLPAYTLAGLMLGSGDPARAKRLLTEAFQLGDPADDPFTQRYWPHVQVRVGVSFGITAEQYLGRDVIGLTLAELHQYDDEPQQALDVLAKLYPSTLVLVSVVDVLTGAGESEQVVELTDGVRNEDDLTALLCSFRGRALRLLGRHDAAHEALKEALRSRSRHSEIRLDALSERAQNYVAQGKLGMARKDLDRIMAEDSTYEGLADAYAELDALP
jgi:tetratricopeptide (TPR) repeat protein